MLAAGAAGAGATVDGGEAASPPPADLPAASADALRSRPDFVVYEPKAATGRDAENQHFLVVPTARGAFLAIWTQSSVENAPDQRVVAGRSADRGRTWSPPVEIDGQRDGDGRRASWGFPLVATGGRILVFYNKNVGLRDVREDTTGELRFKWSDDDGVTWRGPRSLAIRKAAISHPDPAAPESWIAHQAPVRLRSGDVLATFTRLASRAVQPAGDVFDRDSEIWLFRILGADGADPGAVRVEVLPDGDRGLRAPRPDRPAVSVAQEATVVELSGGRLLAAFRTLAGRIYHAVSADGGRSWSRPEPLADRPGGRPLLQPIAPCPLYALRDGRILLVYHANDGTANGGRGPTDYRRNRSPAYLAVGREVPGATGQPVAFGPPRLLAANGLVPAGPLGRTEIATYTSLFEHEGKTYFWYPDRKRYLLGKILDTLLAEKDL